MTTSDKKEAPTAQGNTRGFWQKVALEIGPIVNHGLVVAVLEASLLLIGLLALGLKYLFPKHDQYFSYIEIGDIWICLALLAEFGLYTLILVGIRLLKGLKQAARDDNG